MTTPLLKYEYNIEDLAQRYLVGWVEQKDNFNKKMHLNLEPDYDYKTQTFESLLLASRNNGK